MFPLLAGNANDLIHWLEISLTGIFSFKAIYNLQLNPVKLSANTK